MGKKVSIQLAPRGSGSAGGVDRQWQHAAEACPARWDRGLAGDGIGTDEIQRRLQVSKPTIRRWRTRYVEAGVDGLCRDKTRPPGKAPCKPTWAPILLRHRVGDRSRFTSFNDWLSWRLVAPRHDCHRRNGILWRTVNQLVAVGEIDQRIAHDIEEADYL